VLIRSQNAEAAPDTGGGFFMASDPEARRTTVVLVNGVIDEVEAVQARLNDLPEASVVAADGGSRHAETLGLRLDAVVGDLDSLGGDALARLRGQGVTVERSPAAKDETDFELALLYATQQGARRIVVVGALGGRLDMALANIQLLAHPALEPIRVELWNGRQTAWIIRPPGDEMAGGLGDTLSLIPLGGAAVGVTTHRLAYPLNDETLPIGPARGVSNVFEADSARVDLSAGLLLAVHTPGHA
jgi:thiamine pyrophosphokinase